MTADSLKKWYFLAVSVFMMKLSLHKKEKSGAALLDTSINTDNRGDEIIMHYCRRALDEVFSEKTFVRVPTHSIPDQETLEELKLCREKIICGTNILSCALEYTNLWKLPDRIEAYAGCILMGAGWGFYSEKTSWYTRLFYRNILSKSGIHSVRDRYTLKKLQEAGVPNVIYTGCPTMWALTPELCREIPCEKRNKVVFTVTSYDLNDLDQETVEILCRNYEKVYAWPQGKNDREYIQRLTVGKKNVVLLEESLRAYRELLEEEEVDYVGTRLHGGVMALNLKRRTIIIAVDNRAAEIGKDTGLPFLYRREISEKLETRICTAWETKIEMPLRNIELWKRQFSERQEMKKQ